MDIAREAYILGRNDTLHNWLDQEQASTVTDENSVEGLDSGLHG